MNAQTKTETGIVTGWSPSKQVPEIESDDLKSRWKSATAKVAQLASENDWTKSEVARRADMAIGTFSGWYDGTYNGRYDNTTQRVENFLTSFQEASEAASALPVEPGFVQTRVARELFETFTYAQALPTIAIATLLAGLGKTSAAEAFQASRPHVFHIVLSPSSASIHTMKSEIGAQLGIDTRNSATLKGAIVEALKRDGFSALLIVDEAQYLNEDGVNELRHFRDMARCGLVLLGNNESTTPYASRDVKHASPQVTRRIGYRISVMKPYPEDIDQLLDAWQITDEDVRRVGTAIATRPGALGALSETIKAASMIARGMGRALKADDMRAAYQLRGGGAV
ncbi:AAA family ATPase [Cognatishimia sp. MH4019]|uniref:AAA family ATPase n=1 Tax=Cognatishimia sp. MH4019 TaxID=2854030 RepID=UPI001CD54970|nr:AAA family ATPase [Cognatishimia sp. MH4019]